MLLKVLLICLPLFFVACKETEPVKYNSPFLVVLGIAQDAGFPQAQCVKDCCRSVWDQPEKHRRATCLALVDPGANKYWLFEATPDFKSQVREIESQWDVKLAGIFLTHAHVGHYTGLINLGKEITGASGIPVYSMPRMMNFLETNGPWDQLVELYNIELISLQRGTSIKLTPEISVTPFLVPHRDEYSETAGFKITGSHQQALFIPDIDKWERWEKKLDNQINTVDLAFIDGSFFKDGELPGRDMLTIPHPFVIESMELLQDLPDLEKQKVRFIHFNHTNPLLQATSVEKNEVLAKGFGIAQEGMIFIL